MGSVRGTLNAGWQPAVANDLLHLIKQRVAQRGNRQLPICLDDPLLKLRMRDQLAFIIDDQVILTGCTVLIHFAQQAVNRDIEADGTDPLPLPVERLDCRNHPGASLGVQNGRRSGFLSGRE